MKQKIIDGLLKLDPENDNHWTDEGLPKITALKFSVGSNLTRDDVNEVAPNFTRSNPVFEEVQYEELSSKETEQTQEVFYDNQSESGDEVIADANEAQENTSTIGELTVRVNCDVDTLFSMLGKDLPQVNIEEQTERELKDLEEQLRNGMTADNILLSAVSQLIETRSKLHADVVEEIERRKPKSHLADQLSSFRDAMTGLQHVVNNPRMVVRNGIKTR